MSTVNIVIIPAAGLGTRLHPYTDYISKEILKVGKKPMIQYALEEAWEGGIQKALIIVSPVKIDLIDWIAIYKKKTNRDIEIFYQENATGLGNAILCCKDYIECKPFYLSLPDNVLFYKDKPNPFKVIHKAFKISDYSTIGLISINLQEEANSFGDCGKVELEPHPKFSKSFIIKKIFDKQKGTFKFQTTKSTRTIGRCIISQYAYKILIEMRRNWNGSGEFDDVPWLQRLAKEEILLGTYIQGDVFDVGNKTGFNRANAFLFDTQKVSYKINLF